MTSLSDAADALLIQPKTDKLNNKPRKVSLKHKNPLIQLTSLMNSSCGLLWLVGSVQAGAVRRGINENNFSFSDGNNSAHPTENCKLPPRIERNLVTNLYLATQTIKLLFRISASWHVENGQLFANHPGRQLPCFHNLNFQTNVSIYSHQTTVSFHLSNNIPFYSPSGLPTVRQLRLQQ